MVTGILLHCRNSCNSVIIPNTQLIPYKNTKILKSLLEYTILRLLSQKTTLSFKSYIPYSFIFSHNLCTIAKNVVWDWNADITWYISFFNMCVLDQQTKEKWYTQDILAFLNEDFIIGQSHCLFNMFTKLRHILSLNITPYI